MNNRPRFPSVKTSCWAAKIAAKSYWHFCKRISSQRAVVVATGGVGSRKGRAPRSGRTARRPQPQPAKQQPTAALTLTYGADLYTILGHANVKTTQIYAKIVDENKRKAVNLIPKL